MFRAIERCGLLLKQSSEVNLDRSRQINVGAHDSLNRKHRKQAATDVGLSERQRINTIP
jgi:hypothetical protein